MTRVVNFQAVIPALTALILGGCALDAPTGTANAVAGAVTDGSIGTLARETGFGNNLSVPVIFAEARGITGLGVLNGTSRVFANTGLRPSAAVDPAALAELNALGTLPFWFTGNTPTPYATTPGVYWQKSANTWQAEWDARPSGLTPVTVDWGDNLKRGEFPVNAVVRVEHVLVANDGSSMQGYPMDLVVNPSSPSEQQGILADGGETATVALTPTVFSDRARLRLQKLNARGGTPVFTFFDKAVWEGYGIDGPGKYAAEINVGGKLLFGYVWRITQMQMPAGMTKDGWWRITFMLDGGAGVTFTALGAGDETLATLQPTISTAEVYIGAKRGGGKK
jgi:hypothetical protein